MLEPGLVAAEERTSAGEEVSLPNTLGSLPFTYFRLGRYQDALTTGELTLEVSQGLDKQTYDWATWAARQGMALSSMVLGDFGRAVELATANVEERIEVPAGSPLGDRTRCIVEVTVGTSLQTLAYVAYHLGDYDSATASLHRAMALFEPYRAPYLGYVLWTLGQTYLGLGELEKAQATLERGLEIAHETGFHNQVGHLLSELIVVHIKRSDPTRAEALAKQALETALASGDKWLEATVRSRWGLAALQQGSTEVARERLLTALEAAASATAYGFAYEAVLGMAELHELEERRLSAALLVSFVRQSPLSPAALAAEAGKRFESTSRSLTASDLEETKRAARNLSPPEAFQRASGYRLNRF